MSRLVSADEARALLHRPGLVLAGIGPDALPVGTPTVDELAATVIALTEERDELLTKFTGMDAAGWEQEEKDHAAFLLAENRGGGVVMCPTCGRGSFVDGTADIDLSPRQCFMCELAAAIKEQDRLRDILAAERGERAPEGWERNDFDPEAIGLAWYRSTGTGDSETPNDGDTVLWVYREPPGASWTWEVERYDADGDNYHHVDRGDAPTALEAIEAADRAAGEVEGG